MDGLYGGVEGVKHRLFGRAHPVHPARIGLGLSYLVVVIIVVVIIIVALAR